MLMRGQRFLIFGCEGTKGAIGIGFVEFFNLNELIYLKVAKPLSRAACRPIDFQAFHW